MKKQTTALATPATFAGEAMRALVGEDRALVFNGTSTAALAALATGNVSAQDLAREALAARGVNAAGAWIGFEAARKFWLAGK